MPTYLQISQATNGTGPLHITVQAHAEMRPGFRRDGDLVEEAPRIPAMLKQGQNIEVKTLGIVVKRASDQ